MVGSYLVGVLITKYRRAGRVRLPRQRLFDPRGPSAEAETVEPTVLTHKYTCLVIVIVLICIYELRLTPSWVYIGFEKPLA